MASKNASYRKSIESSRNVTLESILQEAEAEQQKRRKRSFLLPKETNAEFVDELTNDDDEEREEIRREAREDEDRRRREVESTEDVALGQKKRLAFKQLTNLTPAQVEEHYNRCIQLCNQNKVNKNNAFKLQLIDCMKQIMQQPQHTSNLTLAGCTLDASAKIYACRVDKVYSDMLVAISGNRNLATDDSSDERVDDADDDGDPKKKRRKHRDGDDLDFEKFLLSENDLKKERGRDEDAAFLLKGRSVLPPTMDNFVDCPLFGPLGELRLDCPVDYYDDDSTFSQTNPITSICKVSDHTPVDPAKYIPGYKDLHKKFYVVGGDVETSHHADLKDSSHDIPASLVDKALIFEPTENTLSNIVAFVDEDDAAADAEDYELDYDACAAQDTSCPSLPVASRSNLMQTNLSNSVEQFNVGGLSKFVAINTSDYSYFDDSKAKFHAAPSHWSLKPKRKRLSKFLPTTTQKRTANLKKHNLIDFSIDRLDDLKKEFLTKVALSLSQKTMQSWEKHKLKFAYCSYNAQQLLSFMSNDNLLFVNKDLKRSIHVDNNLEDSGRAIIPEQHHDSDSDHDRDDGNMEGPTSPIREIESRLSQRLSTAGFEAEPFASCGLDELIPAPPKVELIQVNYAKIQKRVDIKGLKSAIWNFLDLEKDKENIDSDQSQSNELLGGCALFSKVLEKVPNLMPRDEGSQLGIATIFMAVLHLANEKNLKFTKVDKTKAKPGDFKIELNDS